MAEKLHSVMKVLDSLVDPKSDAKKSGSQSANLLANWSELEKKATKASDSDLTKITAEIKNNPSKSADIEHVPNAVINSNEIIFGPKAPHATPTESKTFGGEARLLKLTPDPFLKKIPPEFQPQLKTENGKLVYTDPLKAVRIEGEGDKRLTAIIGDSTNGGATQLFANPDGSRTVLKDGLALYHLNGSNTGFQAGEFSSDGRTLTQKRDGQTLLIAGKTDAIQYYETMTLYHEMTADSVADAVAKLKERGINLPKDKAALIYLKNGAALVHPELDKVLEFRYSKDGVEVHMDLGEGQELLRSPKGKMYIVNSNDNSVKEISEEQKADLVKRLGPKAQVFRHLLQALENGDTMKFDDGHEVRIKDGANEVIATAPNKPDADGKPQTDTVAVLTDKGYTVDDPSRKVSFDQNTGELVTETDGKKTTVDLDSEHFDMQTDDFVRKDGVVTFDNGTRIADSGDVELPDGTKINAKNDVYFADGSVLYRDGTLVSKDGTVTRTSLNVPQKQNLDAIVSQALSMATAIAGRVHSGSFNPADLALIEANMSVIQNFINLFSLMGNLPVANSLQRSWSILKASHNDAQHESDAQESDKLRRQQEVRAFLSNLEKSTYPAGSDKQMTATPVIQLTPRSGNLPRQSTAQFRQLAS